MNDDLRKKKLAALFATAKEIGYSEKTLREIVEIQTGSESLRALSVEQLKSVIASIRKSHPSTFKSITKSKKKIQSISKNSSVATLRTPDQIAYCKDLIILVNSTTPYKDLTLDKISLRMFKELFMNLSRHQEISLIEALKYMIIRSNQLLFDSLNKKPNNRNQAFQILLKELGFK